MYLDNFLGSNKSMLMFLFIYFGFQIFAQVYSRHIEKLPSTKNYLQNFIFALVLMGLVINYGNPLIYFNAYSLIYLILTFVFLVIYCFSKRALDEMSEKDRRFGKGGLMKSITIVTLFLYGGLALMYLVTYFKNVESMSQFVTVGGMLLLYMGLVGAIYGIKNVDDQDNLAISFFLYPLLFMTNGLERNSFMRYAYIIIFTSVVALWGFFGVEWFTGKKEYENVNAKVCKAYLGITDDQLAGGNDLQTETKLNTKNINFIYTAVGLILVTFVIALVFMFVSFQKSGSI